MGRRSLPVPLNYQFACAVSEAVSLHAEQVEHAQEQIRHWGVGRRHDMTISFQPSGSASQQYDGQRIVVVLISVAHTAAIKKQRMIQQCTVAVSRLGQFFDEIRQHLDVVLID